MDKKTQKLRAQENKLRTEAADKLKRADEIRNEIALVENEELALLARSAAKVLAGGIDDVIDVLKNIKKQNNLNANFTVKDSEEEDSV